MRLRLILKKKVTQLRVAVNYRGIHPQDLEAHISALQGGPLCRRL